MKIYKKYKNLDLEAIREAADLDFAHYTYKKGMCSCCYGPKNLSSKYWKNGKVSGKEAFSAWAFDPIKKAYCTFDFGTKVDKPHDNEFEYLLFKNADNGSGVVDANTDIDSVCVEWGFPSEKLNLVCKMLEEQLGYDYKVIKPKNFSKCIIIRRKLTREDLVDLSLDEVQREWEKIKEEEYQKSYDEEFVLVDDFLDEFHTLQHKVFELVTFDTTHKENFTDIEICCEKDNELANEKVWDKLSSWSYNRCKKYIEFFNKSIPDGATNGDVVKTLLNQ